MPLVSDQLPNLMNGVSQQAITMRLSSQAKVQVNGFSSIVEGTNKRQPTKHLAKMTSTHPAKPYVHTINRDVSERYSVIAYNNSMQVFDLSGVQQTVTFPDGVGYITSADTRAELRAVTVADYTFIVNAAVTVAKLPGLTVANGSEAIGFIRAVNYDVDYKVLIDGVEQAAFTTDKATVTNAKISVEEVVTDLVADLTTNLGAGWTITAKAPIFHIEKDDGAVFSLEVSDSLGNTMTETVDGKVQRFTDLPVVAKRDFIVEVTGDDASDFDNYYLKFIPNNASLTFDDGVWEETVAPGIEHQLDNTTMPHQLVRMPDGSFELQEIDWGGRIAGDLETSPWPSFIGRTINDIYFDRNRLCVLADDNVVMSRRGSYFDYFIETAVTLLDDGPIDIAAQGQKVSILKYAVMFNKRVLLFSDQTQFILSDGPLLASNPPALDEVTAYESDLLAKPVGTGKTLFFTSTRGANSSVMEYYVLPDSDALDASDVTKHVPTYVPAGLFKLAASPTSEVVLGLSSLQPNRAYIYKYFWQGSKKLQSSWSYWEFGADANILNVEFIKDLAYFVVEYPDGVHLECMDVSEGQYDVDAPFVYRLDRRLDETGVIGMTYDAMTQRTTFTLPYEPDVSTLRVVSRHGSSNDKTPATTLDVDSVVGNDVTVVGDLTNTLFYVGQRYVWQYDFSDPVLKTPSASGGQATITAGRLQINKWHVSYANTGYFRAVVSRPNRPSFTYAFTGKKLGTASAKVGEVSLSDGTFGFRVNGKAGTFNISLINDSFLPNAITAAEWEGRYERRTSRI